MGRAGETNPPSILSDPLIPTAAGVPSDHDASSSGTAAVAAEDCLPPISYVHSPRRPRDLPALILFALLSAATLVAGVVAAARRNPDFPRAGSFVFDPQTSSCVPSALSSASPASNPLSFSRSASNILISTLALTFLLAAPISLALLWLLRNFPKQVVYTSIPLFILIPTSLNLYWFVACELGDACRGAFPLAYRILVLSFVFLLVAVALWVVVANWHRVELAARIVGVAAAALSENPALLAVLPALALVLPAMSAPVVVFLVLARFNGRVAPMARNTGGVVEHCCAWEQDGWVPAYYALAIVTVVWWAATMLEAQVYVISGTVAQWYFCGEGTRPRRSLRSSLRNAFGPSFGTVCFSGMVMGVVRVVRAIVDSAQGEGAAPGIINLALRCCAKYLLLSIDFVNKFTVNSAAITGEGYCSSARMTYELLKRNLLSAVFVEVVSTRVLSGISLVLSALYAIAVFAALRAMTASSEMYLVAVLAWLLLAVVLGFLVSVLHSVTDAVYVCYAIDRDRGEVCKHDVHEVYAHLPARRNRRATLDSVGTPLLV